MKMTYLEYLLTNKYISGPIRILFKTIFQINILKGNLYPYILKQFKIFCLSFIYLIFN